MSKHTPLPCDACNSREDLVAALREVVDAATYQINFEMGGRVGEKLADAIRNADAALAKSEPPHA